MKTLPLEGCEQSQAVLMSPLLVYRRVEESCVVCTAEGNHRLSISVFRRPVGAANSVLSRSKKLPSAILVADMVEAMTGLKSIVLYQQRISPVPNC